MKNGGKNKSVAFIILFSVYSIYIYIYIYIYTHIHIYTFFLGGFNVKALTHAINLTKITQICFSAN